MNEKILDTYIEQACKNIKRRKLRQETKEKLRKDILDLKNKYIYYIDDENVALERAIQHFGSPESVAEKISTQHSGWKWFRIFLAPSEL